MISLLIGKGGSVISAAAPRLKENPIHGRSMHILPSLPHVVTKLLEETLDEDVSMERAAELAGRDPGLTVQLLKLANSPLFSRGRAVSSIPQATINLGLQTVRNIAVTLSVYQSFSDLSGQPGFSLGAFWWHSLSTAICSRFLAQRNGYEDPEEAFVAGLLHDLGQLVLIRNEIQQFGQILQTASRGTTLIESERKVWATDHAQVGADLLDKWRLEPILCDAVRYHHRSSSELETALPLVRLVFLGDRLSHYFARPVPEEWSEILKLVERMLGISSDVLEDLQESIISEVNQMAGLFGMKVTVPEGSVLPSSVSDEPDGQKELREKAFDVSLLVGAFQAMLDTYREEDLHDAFLRSLAVLFDFKCLLLAKHLKSGLLAGVRAYGTRRDELASHIKIPVSPGTIWDRAFQERAAVYSNEFSREHLLRVIDRQVESLMGSPYIIVPISCSGEKLGVLMIGMPPEEWEGREWSTDMLLLLTKQMSHSMLGYKYRRQWAKEHAINAAILKGAPVGVLLADLSGRAYYWNPVGRSMLGYEGAGTPPEELNFWRHFSFNLETQKKISECAGSGTPAELGKTWMRDSTGVRRLIDIKAVAVRISDKMRLLMLLEDVSVEHALLEERRKRSEWLEKELAARTEELEKAQEKLLRAERLGASTELARRVVHEINSPLAIIKNFLTIFKMEHQDSERDVEILNTISKEIDRIAGILRQLRDFSSDLAENTGQERGFVQNAARDLEILLVEPLEQKGIDLEFDIDQDLPPVPLSESGIKQVLINLVKNSEEAISGDGRIQVSAHIDRDNADEVIIQVADSGAGVPEHVRERLFDPFVTTKGEDNSGLGLSVCYGLIKASGGSIKVVQKKGWGACFDIRLPGARE